MLKIIYEDSDLLVVEKKAGIESQSSRKFEPDMVSEIKKYLSTNLSPNRQGRAVEPYVGVIHRLDKPVSGVMVYAKNRKSAASLSLQVQNGNMKKMYLAVVCGKLVDNVGNYVDFLLKDGKNNYSRIVDKATPDCKKAELNYRVLEEQEQRQEQEQAQEQEQEREQKQDKVSLVQVELLTGRHHQIRVQFAGHGTPLWGDNKYNPDWSSGLRRGNLALAAVNLSFIHPATGKRMEFSMKPTAEVFTQFKCLN